MSDKSDKKETAIPPITADEIKLVQDQTISKMFGGPPPKPKDAPPEAKPEAQPEPKPDEPKPDETPKAEPKKKVEVPPPLAEVTPDAKPDIREVVREEISKTQPKPEPAPEVLPDLTEEEQTTLHALEAIEAENPGLKGIKDRTTKFWAKETQYIQKWEAEHPGETFDPDSEEHAAFYAGEPSVDGALLERTKRTLAQKRQEESKKLAEKEIDQKVDQRLAQMREQQRIERAVPIIEAEAGQAIVAMVDTATPELGKLIADRNGVRVIDQTVDKALTEANAAAVEILKDHAEPLDVVVHELGRLEHTGQLDPKLVVELPRTGMMIQPAKFILDEVAEREKELLSLPPEKTMVDGKRFVSTNDMAAAEDKVRKHPQWTAEQKQSKLDEIHQRYWTITFEGLRRALVKKFAGQAQAKMAKLGISGAAAASKSTPAAKTETPPTAPADTTRTPSPSIRTASDTATERKTTPEPGSIPEEAIDNKMWS